MFIIAAGLMRLLQTLCLLVLARGIEAFAYSCEEVRYKLMNTNFEHDTEFACVFVQEGFTNWKQLNMIHFSGVSENLQSITKHQCVSRTSADAPWKMTGDYMLSLKCDQEFTIVFSSDAPAFWTPLKQARQAPILAQSVPLQTFVVPQTKMWFRSVSCAGSGNITFWTGAGVVEDQKRFALRSWTCEQIPRMIYSFDSVVTITADGDVEYYVEHSSNMGTSSKPPLASSVYGDHLAVLTSGRSDDLQNRKGLNDARAFVKLDAKHEVSVQMDIVLDPVNTGSVQLLQGRNKRAIDYYTGLSQFERFTTDYFEVRYTPSALQPQQIWNSRDNVVVEMWIGVPPPTPSIPTTKSTTTTVAPTTVATPACQTCPQDLIKIAYDGLGAHEFQSDVTDNSGDCAVRTFTCAGKSANIEINDGSGILGGSESVAKIVLTCNKEGTAWTFAGVPITQLECASG